MAHPLTLIENSLEHRALSLRTIFSKETLSAGNKVKSGIEALKLLSGGGPAPELIVLEFETPGINHGEILRELRKQERSRNVPVVILNPPPGCQLLLKAEE